jgi:hypothetical protein
MPDVTYFKINDMVQQRDQSDRAFTDGFGETRFNGVIVGFTVNSIGEAILLVDMIKRRDESVATMEAQGWQPVDITFNAFWHRISSIHPSAVEPFHDANNLVMDE